MMIREKMPPRPHTPDSSPGLESHYHKGIDFSSNRRTQKNNINSTYNIGLSSQNKKDNIKLSKKPLKVGVSTQITFRGFSIYKTYQASHRQINSNVISKSLDAIKVISPKQHEACKKIIDEFTATVKQNSKFRQKLGFLEFQSKLMNTENLWEIPEESLFKRFAKAVISPVVSLGKRVLRLALDNEFGKKNFSTIYKNIQENKKFDKIINDYRNVTGLFNSVEKWENAYRVRFGFSKIKSGDKFFIPEDELTKSLRKRAFDSINPNISNYSAKSLNTGNRIASGIVGSVFYGIDAYNTTMRLSDNENVSKKEGKVKFAQQMIRITLASYFTATAFGVLKKQTNKSMPIALAVAGAMVVASEVLGRMLVGNPILPTNKKNLEEINERNKNSNNLVIKFGRMLSGNSTTSNKKDIPSDYKIVLDDKFVKKRYSSKLFGSESTQNIAFKRTVPRQYKKSDLIKLLEIIKEIDPKLSDYYKENIVKNLVNKKALSDNSIGKPFEEAIKSLNEIEIGEYRTTLKKVRQALLSPIQWVKNIFKKSSDFIKKIFRTKNAATKPEDFIRKIKEMGLESTYAIELEKFKKSQTFTHKSSLTDEQKLKTFASSFVHLNGKGFGDEIQGIQNSLEWLKKNIKMNKKDKSDVDALVNKILENKDTPEVKKHLQNIGNNMNKMSFTAYAKDYADYDASKYAVANNYTARILSTMFLVFDAYNLAMIHSNDKKKSVDNGAQYATQEVTRTAMSSYIISSTNTIFQSLYNSSLTGALALTALSSGVIAVLSRFAVGSSIRPKSHKELLIQEERNKNNPILKITSAMLGKKMKTAEAN